jgi:hypothetical protein
MNITRLNVSLEQYDICISGTIPDRITWSEPAMDRSISEFVSLFSSIIFKYGGRVIHGASPVFTPIILHQARIHAPKRSRKPVTLVISHLWAKNYLEKDLNAMSDVAEIIITEQIGEGSFENTATRNQSLRAMRKVLVDAQNVMVAVGGKMHDGDGIVPGVAEEMELASEKGIPRFLIAGLGGYSQALAQKLTPQDLANSLSQEDNIRLFGTSDVAACVNTLFEHLANTESLIAQTQQPIKWNAGLGLILDHRDGTICYDSSKFILSSMV